MGGGSADGGAGFGDYLRGGSMGISGLVVTVARGGAIGLKQRNCVGGFAALLCKGFRGFPQVILLCIVLLSWGGSQTPSGHRALSGFTLGRVTTFIRRNRCCDRDRCPRLHPNNRSHDLH